MRHATIRKEHPRQLRRRALKRVSVREVNALRPVISGTEYHAVPTWLITTGLVNPDGEELENVVRDGDGLDRLEGELQGRQ